MCIRDSAWGDTTVWDKGAGRAVWNLNNHWGADTIFAEEGFICTNYKVSDILWIFVADLE